eukprot:GHVP01041631.1.p1 GENE.GHVP01041631.1~~GHVP01041631.1.p1  ORF type:complete len:492 (+),score=103.22 GHVP01041631.1:18-1493(+)
MKIKSEKCSKQPIQVKSKIETSKSTKKFSRKPKKNRKKRKLQKQVKRKSVSSSSNVKETCNSKSLPVFNISNHPRYLAENIPDAPRPNAVETARKPSKSRSKKFSDVSDGPERISSTSELEKSSRTPFNSFPSTSLNKNTIKECDLCHGEHIIEDSKEICEDVFPLNLLEELVGYEKTAYSCPFCVPESWVSINSNLDFGNPLLISELVVKGIPLQLAIECECGKSSSVTEAVVKIQNYILEKSFCSDLNKAHDESRELAEKQKEEKQKLLTIRLRSGKLDDVSALDSVLGEMVRSSSSLLKLCSSCLPSRLHRLLDLQGKSRKWYGKLSIPIFEQIRSNVESSICNIASCDTAKKMALFESEDNISMIRQQMTAQALESNCASLSFWLTEAQELVRESLLNDPVDGGIPRVCRGYKVAVSPRADFKREKNERIDDLCEGCEFCRLTNLNLEASLFQSESFKEIGVAEKISDDIEVLKEPPKCDPIWVEIN